MKYVSLAGLEEYLEGTAPEDQNDPEAETKFALADCEARMLAYITPNTPRCDEQIEAFCQAVYAQYRHEHSAAASQIDGVPEGLRSFTLNGFSATLDDTVNGSMLFRTGISRTSWAILLYAGLLYRGVQQCGCDWGERLC